MSHLSKAGAEARNLFNLIPGLKAGAPTLRRKRRMNFIAAPLGRATRASRSSTSSSPGYGLVRRGVLFDTFVTKKAASGGYFRDIIAL